MEDLSNFKEGKLDHFSGFASFPLGLRGWGGVPNSLRKTSSGFGSSTPCLVGSSVFLSTGKSSKSRTTSSCNQANSPRLSFGSQDDALNYARHVTENSKRRLAAYNLIERYIEGDYYICVSEWYRIGRNDQIYDLIFSSVPDELGDRYPNRSIDAICLDTVDGDVGDNIHLGKLPVFVCDAHAIKREEKVISSFVWLERTKKRYEVRRDILAASFDNGLQSRSVLGKGKIGALRCSDSRGDSHNIGRVIKRSPKMFNSFSGNEGEVIGKRLEKSDLVQIINAVRVTLYDVGPLFCLEKSSLPFFKDKNVLLCARETEFRAGKYVIHYHSE